MMQTKAILDKYARFFETLNQNVPIDEYRRFFSSKTYFEDPFHKIQGDEKIYQIFQSMYRQLHEPWFEVIEAITCENSAAYFQWKLHYKLTQNSSEDSFVGVSRVEFDTDGMVVSHVDYWDASSNVYEKIPLLGSIMRLIKRRINASTKS